MRKTHIHIHFLIQNKPHTNTSVSVSDRPALKHNFMSTLCLFPPSMAYKKTEFTRQVITRTMSKINKRNLVCVNGY